MLLFYALSKLWKRIKSLPGFRTTNSRTVLCGELQLPAALPRLSDVRTAGSAHSRASVRVLPLAADADALRTRSDSGITGKRLNYRAKSSGFGRMRQDGSMQVCAGVFKAFIVIRGFTSLYLQSRWSLQNRINEDNMSRLIVVMY